MSDIGQVTGRVLSTGASIPRLGLGVWQVPDGSECERAVRWALEAGYRLIDTAQAYRNETSVGRAIHDSGVPRGEIFLTTKFYPGHRDPLREAEASLERLGTGYLDLYLVHWPQGGPTRAWPGMEGAVDKPTNRTLRQTVAPMPMSMSVCLTTDLAGGAIAEAGPARLPSPFHVLPGMTR